MTEARQAAGAVELQASAWGSLANTPAGVYLGCPGGYPVAAAIGPFPSSRRTHRRWPWAVRATIALFALVVLTLLPTNVLVSDEAVGTTSAGVTGRASQPVTAGPFHPSRAQLAYFLRIACTDGKKDRVMRWAAKRSVRVVIAGACRPQDLLIVREILQTVNRTVGSPRFIYSALDPNIVISFADQRAFERHPETSADSAAWCYQVAWSGQHGYYHAGIVVEDTPDLRADRSAVLYHEFGHALGLDDTHGHRYYDTVMYFQQHDSEPTRYTKLDLAAIRMLYDHRVDPGETRRQMVRLWGSTAGS